MNEKKKNIAFIGLGVMGFPMAGHLAEKSNCRVTVYNRTEAKAKKWLEHYKAYDAHIVASPAEASQEADFVFCCVGKDEDVERVTIESNGAFSTMPAGSIFVDHSTASAKLACKLAELGKEENISVLDAPISGGQSGAENGVLSIMCGGESAVFEKTEPIMACYGKNIIYIGQHGAGQLTKMVNQIAIAGLLQGLAEALDFGDKAGLDMEKVLQAISAGAAGSWQMQNRSKTMLEGKFDYGFAVDWMQKDLSICLDEAKRNKATLPVTALVSQFYARLQRKGYGRWDSSSLLHLLKQD